MAETAFGTNDAVTVKRWSLSTNREVLKRTLVMKWASKSKSAPIELLDELSKSAGDRIRTTLRMQASGIGRVGDQTLDGHGEALTTYTQDVFIDQLRHMFTSAGRMSEQRAVIDVRAEMRDAAADWTAARMDTIAFNHLCGYTVENAAGREAFTGGNTILAPTNILRAAGEDKDEDMDSAEVFVVTDVDKMVNKAQIMSPAIRPVNVDGKDHYILVLHPNQVRSLRSSSSVWFDVMKASLQGGRVSDNPIFTGALGVWENVIFYSSNRITQGVHSTTGAAVADTRRAILLGAQSGALGFGRAGGLNRYNWVEEEVDKRNKYEVAVGTIHGFVKTQYNSSDYATIVYTTFANDPF